MKTSLTILLTTLTTPALLALELPQFFSDGMVLQQKKEAPIWGWADPGTKITASFAGQNLDTTTNPEGKWTITFSNLEPTKTGSEMTVTAGEKTKTIANIVVGEVWIASGQSNMEWPVSRTSSAEEAKTASDPLLRVYLSKNIATSEPQTDFPGNWAASSPETNQAFTAVGYEFAKRLRSELDVPVGIIECAWGGKPIEAFTSLETLKDVPEAKELLAARKKAFANYNPRKIKKQQEAYQAALTEWQKEKEGPQPKEPGAQNNPHTAPNLAGNLWNGMIHPLAGYGARGAIWYQGESNARNGSIYGELQTALVENWRQHWGQDFSFYYVQLANFRKPSTEPGQETGWITVQDEQRRFLNTAKHTGMAVINDIGDEKDIHPKNKKDVGNRLARWALHLNYKKSDLIPSGPLYADSEIKGDKILINFKYANGLKSRDGTELKRFEIAGQDGKWHWADAKIDGETVIVSSPDVRKPKKARYAWAENPTGANLVNSENLPTSVFVTE